MPSKSKSATKNQDAVSMLKEDHDRVKELLEKLERSSGRAGSSRDNLLSKIEAELKMHTQLEEEIFYPAYKEAARKKEDKKLFFEANEEHHVVDWVLGEFDGDAQPEEFAARVKVLKDMVEHHIKEEEKEMFPRAKKAMGSEELRDLGVRMQERKQELEGAVA